MQFPFLPAFAGILLHTAVVWISAYAVAPSIIHLEQQEQQQQFAGASGAPAVGSSNTTSSSSSVLRCDNPRFGVLLSCRPAWMQCLTAALLVAIPALLATLSQRWLWGRYHRALAKQQLHGTTQPIADVQPRAPYREPREQQQASPQGQRKDHQQRPLAVEQQHNVTGRQHLALLGVAGPSAAPQAPLGDPFYQSRVRSSTVSIKVRRLGTWDQHAPGCRQRTRLTGWLPLQPVARTVAQMLIQTVVPWHAAATIYTPSPCCKEHFVHCRATERGLTFSTSVYASSVQPPLRTEPWSPSVYPPTFPPRSGAP